MPFCFAETDFSRSNSQVGTTGTGRMTRWNDEAFAKNRQPQRLKGSGRTPFTLYAGLLNFCILCVTIIASAPWINAGEITQPSRLDASEIWYPHKNYPKLTTPQWVGDEGVDCVVTLAIDDMRDPAKYEAYLRPILQRLKQIDGRAAVSIMTCAVKPDDPQLQEWLKEGLSLECHTFDHPCPILAGSDFKKSKGTYDKCVDLMMSIPNSRAVAFRTPCCDSLNTVSPRLFSEIINQVTPAGHFLQLDSSVFMVYTADDPALTREQVTDTDGREKFRKYIPRKLTRGALVHDGFVNLIENYPYPYVIQNKCWEFPCMTPSDWSANHLHKPNNPDTVRDLKIALDITVQKQGVFNLVFHPHGWIKSEQVIELIDHAVNEHGKKVKFLTFSECLQRLNSNLLQGSPLRSAGGDDQGLRLVDINQDQHLDVIHPGTTPSARVWRPAERKWVSHPYPADLVKQRDQASQPQVQIARLLPPSKMPTDKSSWSGYRRVDLNQDGHADLVLSDPTRFGAWLFNPQTGICDIELVAKTRGPAPDPSDLPPIVLGDGSDNGFFIKDRHLCWINEQTDGLVDFVRRISFDDLLGDRMPDAKSPEAAIQSMRVAPGYRIELVAHEPQTMDPVALDWGPDGRMWVAEMADYPSGVDGQGKPGGRVRLLEDTNGDGFYEKSTLFLDGVPFPNGVLAWKKGVLVSAAPDVFYAEDTDGDGKADIKKVLLTGFAEGNQQHRVNGFSRGLDHWIYLANGDSGGAVKVVEPLVAGAPLPDGEIGKTVDIRGRDLRFRPDTGEIEAIAGQTQFGRNRDDWGNWFGNNNSRPLWHYVLDDHYLRRNPNLIAPTLQKDVSIAPGAAPVFPTSRTLTRFNDFHTANRFTSACASMVFRDELLDSSLPPGSAQVFISEPVHNLVHREILQADGMTFTSRRFPAEDQSEFLTSSDNWFRPTQIKTGPDGALYIADMYRLVIEHPQWIPIEWQRRLDLRAGQDKGRIWRVAPVSQPRRPIARLDQMTTLQLVAALKHPNGWQRDLAQQLLIDRQDATSIALLADMVIDRSDPASKTAALGRLHAVCTLQGLMLTQSLHDKAQIALQSVLGPALADPHPQVRRHAVRMFESLPLPSDELWRALAGRVEDADPQVRLQLAYTLGEIRREEAGPLLGRLALGGAANDGKLEPQFMAAILSSLNPANLGPILSEVTKQGSTQTDLLQQLLAQATAFNHEGALVALLTTATEPNSAGGYERWQFAAVEQFLVSLQRRFTTLDKWLKDLSPAAKPIVSRLESMFGVARKLAADDTASAETRIASVRILGRTADPRDDLAVLCDLITPRQAPELQSAALATLAQARSADIARTLIANYRSLAPGLRTQTCDILLSRDAWHDELLSALESKQLTSADLDAATRQRLLDHKNKTVADRAARVLVVDLNSDRARLVADYLPIVRAGGDPQWGSQIFKKMCSQCHKLGDVGHAVGPDLMSLTDKSPDALIAAVLDPNRAVETKFLTFTAVTRAGVTHTGIMASETAASITLRAAEGKEVTLLRQEIDELQSNAKSLMPEGLERDLKPSDAAALVSYIRLNVPLPAMKSFAGNKPRVVAADAQGTFLLTPFEAEIYGSTIVIEEHYKNLGWWSSADDLAVWTINVSRPGRYQVSWNYACEPSAAGNRLIVEAAGKSLTHRVQKTKSWDDYQQQSLGELELPAGEVRITLKPAARPLPALSDVKTVMISPVK